MGKSGFRIQKSNVEKILHARDMDIIQSWGQNDTGINRILISTLFSPKELIRWRAIEAIGLVARQLVQTNPEGVRQTLTRLFWMMNEESGNLCWHAPEAIGEILVNVPSLIDEYGLVLSSFVIEEPFERGTRLAIARAARLKKKPFVHVAGQIAETLNDDHPEMRAASILALKSLGDLTFSGAIGSLMDDPAAVMIYNFVNGDLEKKTVGELVRGRL
nr:hypothetical protein [candidate division Zixibacteria bacterium]